MVLRRAAAAAALLLLAVSPVLSDNFTMGRYNGSQTSYTTETLKLPLSLSWEFTGNKFAGNSAAPIVADGVCYYTCGDRMYAIDLETGNQKWKYPGEYGLHGSIKTTPAIYDGNIYFGGGDGNLYCLDASTGAFKWAYATRGPIRCQPVIVDGTVYFGSDDDSIYAVDAESGELTWNNPLTGKDDFSLGIAVNSGIIIASCMDGVTCGVTASNGRCRWMFRMTSVPLFTSPILDDNIAVVTAGDSVYGVGAKSGQLRWSLTLPAEAAATPATDGKTLYVPCRDKNLYAYSIQVRRPGLKWAKPVDLGTAPMSSPTISGDVVYVTSAKGVVAGYSTIDGTLKWRYVISPSSANTPGADYTDVAASPTIGNGALLVVSDDGVLHCFKPGKIDYTAPQAIKLVPSNGAALSGVPPIKMSAILYDQGSGVDFSSVSMTLDGLAVASTTDYSTSTVSYTTDVGAAGKSVKSLPDGPHNISISVKDYAGNLLTQNWYFIADSSLPPPKITKVEGKKTKEPKTKDNKRNNRNRSDQNDQTDQNGQNGQDNNNNNNQNGTQNTPPMPPMPPGMDGGGSTPSSPGGAPF